MDAHIITEEGLHVIHVRRRLLFILKSLVGSNIDTS